MKEPPPVSPPSSSVLKQTQVSTANAFSEPSASRLGAFTPSPDDDPFAAPPSRIPLSQTGSGVEQLVDQAKANVEIARRYILSGGVGFAASNAHLAMMQLADAALLHFTGKFFADRSEMIANFRRVVIEPHVLPAECYLHLVDGARFAIGEGSGDADAYVSPPTAERAREELLRAEAFLAETIAALGLTRVG